MLRALRGQRRHQHPPHDPSSLPYRAPPPLTAPNGHPITATNRSHPALLGRHAEGGAVAAAHAHGWGERAQNGGARRDLPLPAAAAAAAAPRRAARGLPAALRAARRRHGRGGDTHRAGEAAGEPGRVAQAGGGVTVPGGGQGEAGRGAWGRGLVGDSGGRGVVGAGGSGGLFRK